MRYRLHTYKDADQMENAIQFYAEQGWKVHSWHPIVTKDLITYDVLYYRED